MASERVNVLFVEDSEADVELAVAALAQAGLEAGFERVDSEGGLRAALARPDWQVVISDFAMPGFDGLAALEIVIASGIDVPFIFVSGVLGEDRAVAAMRAGARDYVLKDSLARLGPAIRREVAASETRRRRRAAEDALRVEQLRYRKIFESAAIGLLAADLTALKDLLHRGAALEDLAEHIVIRDANDDAVAIMEADNRDELLAEFARLIVPGSRDAVASLLEELTRPGRALQREVSVQTLKGNHRRYLVSSRLPAVDEDWSFVVVSLLDVTERWRLEQSLSKSQRMEALGRLAGGVAHDFNNLLTVINSITRFIGESVPPGSATAEDVALVLDAARRAAELTRQLLAFSRDEAYRPVVVDANEAIHRVHRMLSRILEASIDFGLMLGDDVAKVFIDPLQLDQVVLNLVMNARDAMPVGGTLRIATSMEPPPVPAPDGKPFLCIRVTDTGHGMDEATRARIFEPFFTSKAPGKGTGLGLAIVYGVVNRHGGQLDVTSSVGHGSSFAVYLPGSHEEPVAAVVAPAVKSGGREAILVVEDHDLVRRTAQRILEQAGYKVTVAASGAAALAALDGKRVDLVVSDLIMPGMSGLDVRAAIRTRHPGVAFLLTSAYGGAALSPQGLPDGVEFLPKPYSAHELLSRVRAVLDQPRPA